MSVAAACLASAQPASAVADTVTGASLAACTPAPCEPPAGVERLTLANVSNDDGSTSPREYGIYRPRNLSGPAPAVIVFYGNGSCGVTPAGRFSELAVANRFVVVYVAVPPAAPPCGRTWEKRNVGPSGTTVPDDEPYVRAVVNDITRCPGECVDPQRIYAAGISSGGSMVGDVMCDVENSPLFRGYLIDSSSLELFGGTPHCPSTNRNFFVMLALGSYGADAGLYYDTAPKPHLDVSAFAAWAADRLECPSEPQEDMLGSPVASTLAYTYAGPCAFAATGSPAVMSFGVLGGAHGWSCQDSDPQAPLNACPGMPEPPGLENGLPRTNGLFVEEQFWDFVAHGVSSEPAADSGEPPPPPPDQPNPPTRGTTNASPPAGGTTAAGGPCSHSIAGSVSNLRHNTRAWRAAIALAAGAAFGGCAANPAQNTGRPAPIVHVPSSWRPTRSVPLVVALHPSGSSPAGFESASGWDRVADRHGFVVAYLGSAAPAWKQTSNVAYIASEIRQLTRRYNIDRARVYVTGFSAGAYISYFTGCRLSSIVTAIAAVSGAMAPQRCKLARPVSELTIFGTRDIIPLAGTRRFPGAAEVAARWRMLDHCHHAPKVSIAGPVRERTWSRCARNAAVALYILQGGRHVYPGSPKLPTSQPDSQFQASEAIWRFFAAHRAPG
jgi:polyhydroxybutyrate depolymerase